MLMSYSCDERTGYHGLKPLAREFEGAGFWELDRAKGNRELLYGYNAKDAAYTQRLAAGKLNTWLDEEGTREPYTKLLIPAVNAAKEIQARGARIDARLLEHLEEEWGNERDDEKDKMQDVAKASGWPDSLINLNSPKQLSKLLYQIIGLPGGPSTSKANLDALEGMHPFVDALLEYRHLEHNYKIYLDGFTNQIRRHGSQHGRVHPTVKLHGTVTGRRSYSDPAVQTIPRPSNYANKYGKLRQAFIPTNDDYEIAYVDYSRAEIYTAFGYSQDPVMWNALQKDYHLETAVNVMHKSRERMALDADYREEMRRIAKIVTFGILYGMEDYALSMTAGISVQEARDYIEQFFVTNAKYAKFYRDTLRTLERTGEITSLTGRKRRFVLLTPNPRALKQAVNFPIQSTAGDCTLMSLIQLHPMLKQYDSHILFDVHDAIVFEVAKKYRHIVLPLITNIMESPKFPDTHPEFPSIPTEAYIGSSWGHAKKIKDVYNLPPPTSMQTRPRQLMVDRKRTFTVVA
jgi:DNA polymerase-1